MEHTIVAVVADHGEEFLEHGGLSHARTLYDEILRVPWILYVPGRAPDTVDQPVSLVDLAPTLLELLKLPRDARMQGVSALEARGERPTVHEGLWGGSTLARAVRTHALKIIVQGAEQHAAGPGTLSESVRQSLGALGYLDAAAGSTGPRLELYDLSRDPGETHDRHGEVLPPDEQAGVEQLLSLLDATELR